MSGRKKNSSGKDKATACQADEAQPSTQPKRSKGSQHAHAPAKKKEKQNAKEGKKNKAGNSAAQQNVAQRAGQRCGQLQMYRSPAPAAALQGTGLQQVRVYWDAENIKFVPKWHAAVLKTVEGYGRVTTMEVFASGAEATALCSPHNRPFRPPGAMLHTVLDSGTSVKNKTDMTLALEAFSAAVEHPSSTFMIVSEDKDFEPLVMKLQSKGCVVIVATAGISYQCPCSYTTVADHWIDLREQVSTTMPPPHSARGNDWQEFPSQNPACDPPIQQPGAPAPANMEQRGPFDPPGFEFFPDSSEPSHNHRTPVGRQPGGLPPVPQAGCVPRPPPFPAPHAEAAGLSRAFGGLRTRDSEVARYPPPPPPPAAFCAFGLGSVPGNDINPLEHAAPRGFPPGRPAATHAKYNTSNPAAIDPFAHAAEQQNAAADDTAAPSHTEIPHVQGGLSLGCQKRKRHSGGGHTSLVNAVHRYKRVRAATQQPAPNQPLREQPQHNPDQQPVLQDAVDDEPLRETPPSWREVVSMRTTRSGRQYNNR